MIWRTSWAAIYRLVRVIKQAGSTQAGSTQAEPTRIHKTGTSIVKASIFARAVDVRVYDKLWMIFDQNDKR